MFSSATEATEVILKSGWFLEHAYIIPLIPAVAFALIIFLEPSRDVSCGSEGDGQKADEFENVGE